MKITPPAFIGILLVAASFCFLPVYLAGAGFVLGGISLNLRPNPWGWVPFLSGGLLVLFHFIRIC